MGEKTNSKKNNKGFLKLLKKNKLLLIIFLASLTYAVIKIGNTFRPIEQLAVPSALGYDIEKKGDTFIHRIPVSIYNYPNHEVGTTTISGEAGTLPETRETRQTQANGKFIIGLEKVIIIGEDAAAHGIRNFLDLLIGERTVNDTAYVVVCKGKAMDMLNLKVNGVPGVGDYLSTLIRNLTDMNFMSNNYRLIDAFVRADTQGRSLVLPYIEIQKDKPQVTGLAMFSKEKMLWKVTLKDAKILNLLRESNVRGLITVMKDSDHYANFFGTSKRKVKSYMKNGKLTFDITLNLKGELISNTLYENAAKHPEVTKKIEKDLKAVVEEECNEFVKDMQTKYKIDCLELGRYGIRVLGHDAVTDWDRAISESQINVTANVKITEIGRGDY